MTWQTRTGNCNTSPYLEKKRVGKTQQPVVSSTDQFLHHTLGQLLPLSSGVTGFQTRCWLCSLERTLLSVVLSDPWCCKEMHTRVWPAQSLCCFHSLLLASAGHMQAFLKGDSPKSSPAIASGSKPRASGGCTVFSTKCQRPSSGPGSSTHHSSPISLATFHVAIPGCKRTGNADVSWVAMSSATAQESCY